MKIYKYEPKDLIRLMITSQLEKTEYLNLCETTISEVKELCEKAIAEKMISPFTSGKKTSINIREAIGAKNGKGLNISFRGLTPTETLEIILNKINS